MSELETLRKHTNDARNAIVEQKGSTNRIDGACHENAVFLCDYIQEHTEHQPYLRWGAVHYYGYEFDDLKEAEHKGAVHFWVEIETNDCGWVNADLFTMESLPDGLRRGDVFASTGIPETYQRLDDTLFEYDENVINSEDILDYMDYELLCSVIEPVE